MKFPMVKIPKSIVEAAVSRHINCLLQVCLLTAGVVFMGYPSEIAVPPSEIAPPL